MRNRWRRPYRMVMLRNLHPDSVKQTDQMKRLLRRFRNETDGSVFVEYLLLVTLIGIGVIAGLAAVRDALLSELGDLATAIAEITCP